MPVLSSGLLLYRIVQDSVEILLGHMGGPYWENKHNHAWSIPKGEHETTDTNALDVAEREFAEELGSAAPQSGPTINLGSVKSGNKRITAFAREGSFDADAAVSNLFEMEWPRNSGRMQSFPEIDKAAWVSVREAKKYLTKSQGPFVDRLLESLEEMKHEGRL